MKKFNLFPMVALLLLLGISNLKAQSDLMITGVFDGPRHGGTPKGVELCAINEVLFLSNYGVAIAANGGPAPDAPTVVFQSITIDAGDFVYVASEDNEFNSFFGIVPTETGGVNVNGDDVFLLYHRANSQSPSWTIVDAYGEVGVAGSGTAWEYKDRWAYRKPGSTPTATFNADDWTYATADFDAQTNADCSQPFPIGTFGVASQSTIDWCNLQSPETATADANAVFEVYARVHAAGVTETPGAGANLHAWVGYSTENTDPATWTDATWVPATYNMDYGNNDEYKASVTIANAGTYYYASRFKLGVGEYKYGGYTAGGGNIWGTGGAISGTATISEPAPLSIGWCDLDSPETLTADKDQAFDVYARVYAEGVTNAAGQGANIQAWIGYSDDKDADFSNWTWVEATYTEDVDFNLNDKYKAQVTISTAGTYYYVSRFQLGTGEYKYGGYNSQGGGFYDGSSCVAGVATINEPTTPTVDWCNLQHPETATADEGQVFEVFARVYEPGVTDAVGQGANIQAWIGYSTENTDPATWTDATWVETTFQGDDGVNNDEYKAEITIANAGTYYYASRFQLASGEYKYGGYNSQGGGFWDGTTNVNGTATISEPTPASITWCALDRPETVTVDANAAFDVYARVNAPGVTDGEGQGADIQAWIGYSTENTNPATWTDAEWVEASYDVSVGNADEYKASVTIANAGTYYYASRFQLASGEYKYGGYNAQTGGFWDGTTNVNGTATVNTPVAQLTLPFAETFETWPLANWDITAVSTGQNTYAWEQNDGSAHGPNNVIEGTYAAMFNVYDAARGSTTTMTTKLIDMTSAAFPELTFQYWMDGPEDPGLWLKVEMSTDAGATWTEIFKQEQDGTIKTWTKVKIGLLGTNATTQIRLVGSSDFGYTNLFVDDLKIENNDYPVPIDLQAANITPNSADLSWTELSTATQWNIKVASSSIDPATGTGDVYDGQVNAAQYSLSNLTQSANYYVYVQSDHGSGNVSEWSKELKFKTPCGVVSEFSENFDGVSYPDLPDCWDRLLVGDAYVNLSTGFPNSGANALYFYNGGILLAPNLSNAGDGTHQLSFYAMSGYSASSDLEVGYLTDVSDATSFVVLQTITLNQTYKEYIVVPGNAPGADGYLAFRAPSLAVNIDDISWAEIPSCPKPVDLTVSNITSEGADLAWTESGSATEWNIKIATSPIDPAIADGNFNISTTTNPHSLTGLVSATTYYVYVQAACSADDMSAWSQEAMFTTECGALSVPYTQEFEGPAMPNCWTVIDEDGDNKKWGIIDPLNGAHSGVYSAGVAYNSTKNNDWLISPKFEVSSDNIEVEFYAKSRSLKESFNVLLSTTGNTIADFTTTLENVVEEPIEWTKHSYKLSDYGVTQGQTVYIAIQCVSEDKYYLYVDDFSVKEGDATTNPQVNQIDINSAVQNISVCKGTSEEDVKASLPSEIVITDTDDQEHTVSLTWTIASYDANTTGNYDATGIFELPTGVDQTDPATALEVAAIVTVSDAVTPIFSFATNYCVGATAEALPTMSSNAIEGTWSPATISTDVAGSIDYTFTPTNSGCASEVIVNVTVSASVAPTFDFATTYCAGVTAEALPTTSTNGVEGTWSPATISTDEAGSTDYTFTPNAGQGCASVVTVAVTVNAATEPTFSFATEYCVGATADELPTTSSNGVEGTWSPATISTDEAGSTDYTFTPNAGQGCVSAVTVAVTVNELPVVTCPDDMTVTTKDPVDFTGQTPEGGTFSGTGVVGNTFVADGLDNETYVVTYTYTNDSGCENSCEFNVVVNLPIGVTDIASNDIKVYPNPSNGNFQLELNLKDSKEAELQIVNTLGEVVVRENITNTDSFVRNYNTKLQSGAYIIRIRLNDRIITKTLIVK